MLELILHPSFTLFFEAVSLSKKNQGSSVRLELLVGLLRREPCFHIPGLGLYEGCHACPAFI